MPLQSGSLRYSATLKPQKSKHNKPIMTNIQSDSTDIELTFWANSPAINQLKSKNLQQPLFTDQTLTLKYIVTNEN